MTVGLNVLKRLCAKWGGKLVVASSNTAFDRLLEHDDDMRLAPFEYWHGLNWETKTIFTTKGHVIVGAIIHEMGHVFADKIKPGDSKEFEWLGWEIAVARVAGCYRQWSKQNANYQVDDTRGSWGGLSRHQRRALAVERLSHAKTLGIVDDGYMPIAIR